MSLNPKLSQTVLALFVVVGTFCSAGPRVHGQEAQWIWHPKWNKSDVPKVATYYRKTFRSDAPDRGEIFIAADDKYELFLNNKKIGSGTGTDSLDRYDISKSIKKGKNVIAVRVDNLDGNTAALAARVQIKDKDKGWKSYSTNKTWKTSSAPLPIWKFQFFNDSGWKNANTFGKLGSTPPWDKPLEVVKKKPARSSNNVNDDNQPQEPEAEFFVEDVFDDEEVGSIIAFEFNEFGKIIASPEKGGLVLLDPQATSKKDRVKVLTDEIKAIQGILPLNGDIYVTGIYNNKLGLYLLKDKELDDRIDEITEILSFKGYPGEHGAHGVVLGYDGKIYVTVGNHVAYDGEPADESPYSNYYEGSIVKRYEDPGGHAKGIRAPGGTIIRTDLAGEKVEVVAGGLRNSYDLAFNKQGDLFTYDSDMETDIGMTWYRPTHFYHVVDGADFGWRSGWAKWPTYYVDTLPPVTQTGRGSPTGMVVYDHVMFPVRYQGTMFIADWSGGKIYNVALSKNGSSYTARKELFVEGSPLNVTDLAIGPDGALYFSTGGRMTNGGVYRVKWKGEVPKAYRTFNDNLSKIIRQPQPQSAYARQKLAELRTDLDEEWDKIVMGVALSDKNPEVYRTHAIDLMMLLGPVPNSEMLIRLSQDSNENVRAKAVRAMTIESDDETEASLIEMLADESQYVQRIACETLAYLQVEVEYEKIKPLLISNDRFLANAARQLLSVQSIDEIKSFVLETEELPEFVRGSVAIMAKQPTRENAYAILARVSELLDGFISDKDFLEMLRLVQVTIERGEVEAEKIPAFAKRMADEFPSGNSLMNRELVKIITGLQVSQVLDRLPGFLNSPKFSTQEKLDIAMHLQLIEEGWSTEQKLALIDYLEGQIRKDMEGNFGAYIRIAVREFARNLTPAEAITALKRGKSWPNAAMSAFYKLPKELDKDLIADLKKLDKSIQKETEETYTYIKKGIIAMLSKGGAEGEEYLKEIWRRDAERRKFVAIAFALKPNEGTWPYLIASINEVEQESTEVMRALLKIPQKPEGAKYYRMIIVKALKLDDIGKLAAIDLLEFWTGENSTNKLDPDAAVVGWQKWFAEKYPDEPPAEVTVESESQKWTVSLLKEVLEDKEATKGSKVNGKLVFKKAQCSNCHRFINFGDALGPDLTTVARRFTTKEILESVIHPSDVISDQYRSELVATADGRQFNGIVSTGPNSSLVVLQSDGKKVQISADNIEARKKSKTSVMPANLLEKLSKQEIIDLFTYMGLKDENRIADGQRFRTR